MPVSFEAIGKARGLRSRLEIAAIAATAEMRLLCAESTTIAKRRGMYGSTLREKYVGELVRRWKVITPVGLLSQDIKVGKGPSLHVAEVRVTAFKLDHTSFSDLEPALGISRTTLSLEPRRCAWSTTPIATLNLHAVGRRYERSLPDDVGDEHLLRDLKVLAVDAAALLAARPPFDPTSAYAIEDPFTVSTRFGEWRGLVHPMVSVDDNSSVHLVCHARTWLNSDAIREAAD